MTTNAQSLSYLERLLILNKQIAVHFRRHWLKWAMLLALAFVFQQHYMVGVNIAPSLPQRIFLIAKGEAVAKGDYVAFRWHGQGGFYVGQSTFTKIVRGVAGDVVTVKGQEVFINGDLVALAKQQSSTGKPMEVAHAKVLGQGELFVYAPNPSSLDSRYSVVGYISNDDVIGRAIPIF